MAKIYRFKENTYDVEQGTFGWNESMDFLQGLYISEAMYHTICGEYYARWNEEHASKLRADIVEHNPTVSLPEVQKFCWNYSEWMVEGIDSATLPLSIATDGLDLLLI